MRYLHHVQMHEKFIASGTHRVTQPEIETVEHWSIHEQPGGTRLVRIDKEDQRRVILLEAWVNLTNSGRVIERIDFYGRSKLENTPVKTIKAAYNFFDDHIQIGRTINETERDHGEFAIASPYIGTYSASMLLHGYTIVQVAQIGIPYAIASPEMDFFQEDSFSFDDDLDWMNVKPLGDEDVMMGSKVYKTRKFEVYWEKDRSAPTAIAYLDANDVLIKLDHLKHAAIWQFDLINYARRPA